MNGAAPVLPNIVPLGDCALLVRFGLVLEDLPNRRALAFAARLDNDPVGGVVEVVPSLVSVLVRYDPWRIDPVRLSGELSLRLTDTVVAVSEEAHQIKIRFGGAMGPDLDAVATALQLSAEQFIDAHNAKPLRVLATGFAPGFVYCGFHPPLLMLPRRNEVRPVVPAGSVLFAAGQTAIAATDIPTGWHVIGHTDFSNFNPARMPPTRLWAGDAIKFEVAP